MYDDMGETSLSTENTRKAWQLRDRAGDQEKFFIDFSYDRVVTGNLEKARQIGELWAQTYPRDAFPHSFLGGAISFFFGKFEKAAEEEKQTMALNPDLPFAYFHLAASYVVRDRLAEGQTILQQASERKLDIPELLILRYHIAFLKNDKEEMERLARLGEQRSDMDDWMTGREAFVLAYTGHFQQARRQSQRAVDLALQAGRRERAAQHQAGAALREILFGNALEARRSASASLELSNGRDSEYGAALALALSGDSSRSQTLKDDLQTRFPEDTMVRFSYLPTLGALLALNHHQPSQAIEFLQVAAPYELGSQDIGSVGFVGSFYPIYIRGEVYLASRKGPEAAAEFQKILDHRAIVGSDPIGALAQLQIGRAYNLAGDRTKAKAAYQDFLTRWKDADPDIPVLKQAKTEFAKLQ
jgi:predicted Zn-dependent protease